MERALDLQTLGSVVVISAFIAAETAAWSLAAFPASSWAWYLNLEVFRAFEIARADASPLRYCFGPSTLPAACAALLLVLAARWSRFRFGVAAAANLSFCVAIALAYAAAGPALPATVSLAPLALRESSHTIVVILLVTAFVSCGVSHASFFAAIKSDTDSGDAEQA